MEPLIKDTLIKDTIEITSKQEKVQCTKWRLSYTVKLLIKDTIEISNKRQGSMYQVENFL